MSGTSASRAADYTIKGFLYQFNKTLLAILNAADDDLITVEGIIEDVEVKSSELTTAIQCKYHEASSNFSPSTIFKPVLQMLVHHSDHQDDEIQYVLFAHFPGQTGATSAEQNREYIRLALQTNNKDLVALASRAEKRADFEAFLSRFSIEFGPSYDDLSTAAAAALEGIGIPEQDIETVAYPNAINLIAELSIQHDPKQRCIRKREFCDKIRGIHKTAITRWTLALKKKSAIFDARRKQLKPHLDANARLRYLVFNASKIDDFGEGFVMFVKDYLAKYHFKAAHLLTPVFCISCAPAVFDEIEHRLFKSGIVVCDGYVGSHFEEQHFFREPFVRVTRTKTVTREFVIRLLHWDTGALLVNSHKPDDLFIVGEPESDGLDTVDVDVEVLAITSLRELKYLMGMSNVYE